MGLAVTAQQMIDAARSITKTETLDPSNSFCTNAELLTVLNGELAEIEDTILEVQDEEYQSAVLPITLQKDQSLYPLPVDGLKVRSVDVEWQNGVKKSAHRFMEADRNRFQQLAPAWSTYGQVYFRTNGDNLELIPTPQTSITLYVNYTPTFSPLESVSDPYDSHNGWHLAAVWGLAAYIAQADSNEEKAALCYQQKERQLARVRTQAATRVTGEAPTIQRVRNRAPWED